MVKLSDPRVGTRLLKERPTFSALREACEKLYEPIERDYERQRSIQLEPPRRPRTEEEQARIDDQVADARRQLGIPARGLDPRGVQHRPLPPADPARMRAVIEECNGRKVRKENL